jgi:hypothetical protein
VTCPLTYRQDREARNGFLKIKQLASALQKFNVKVQIETEADLEVEPKWPTKVLRTDLNLEEDVGDDYESDYDGPPPAPLGSRKRKASAPLSKEFVSYTDDDNDDGDDEFDSGATPGAKAPKKAGTKKTKVAKTTPDKTPESSLGQRKSTGGRGGPVNPKKGQTKVQASGSETGPGGQRATRSRKAGEKANPT